MTTFLQTLETFFWNVLNRPGLSDIADILIVAIIIYELLMLTRDTRGSAVLPCCCSSSASATSSG